MPRMTSVIAAAIIGATGLSLAMWPPSAAVPERFGISAYAAQHDGHVQGFVYAKRHFENKESCENFVATDPDFASDRVEFIAAVVRRGGDPEGVKFACEPIRPKGQDI